MTVKRGRIPGDLNSDDLRVEHPKVVLAYPLVAPDVRPVR